MKECALRILLVTETLMVGGAETFALRLARKLRQLGHECDLLSLNADMESTALVAQYADVPIIRVRLPAIRWLKRIDRFLRRDQGLTRLLTARWFRRWHDIPYDVYHTNLFGSDRLFADLKLTMPWLRIVSTMHGDYNMLDAANSGTAVASSERTRINHWPAKFAHVVAQVDRWVTISADQHRLLLKQCVAAHRISRIPNGYEPPADLPPSHEQSKVGLLTFVMVARDLPEKGWRFLLEAFVQLQGDCRLLLVGSGNHLSDLSQQYIDPRIVFAGFHPNPSELIALADVFVFPSLYPAESLPTVIVEALFCSLPVIATDVGEVSWMLTLPGNRKAGVLLAPEADSLVPKLVDAMQHYLDDRAGLSQDSVLAREAFAKFDMTRCANAYVEVYRDATARPAESSY